MEDNRVIKLIKKIIKDDSQSAFKELYDLYYNRFFRIAFYYVKKDEWAQEIVLDIFLNIWQQRNKLSEISSWDNYCFILIKNASLNFLEKELKRTHTSFDSIPETEAEHSSPEQHLLNEELFMVYEQALNELPTKCREIYLAIREEKLSYTEAASRFSISNKTVDAQVQKASTRIKEKIKHYLINKE